MERKIKVFLLICFSLIIATACGESEELDSGESGDRQLVITSWGGAGTEAQRKAWYEPFMEETGIEIKEVSPPSTSQLKAQVDSGNVEWDIVLLDAPHIVSLNKEGDYLDKIPYEDMDQGLLEKLPEEAKRDDGIGAYYWAWALAYRTDVFDEEPKGWKDFWDIEKFPGPRTLPNQPHANLEIALMAMGEEPSELYPIEENKVEEALDKINEVEPHISKFWDAGAEGAQLLANSEAVMGNVFTTQVASLIQEGVPVEVQWNQGIYAMDYWVVPKGQMNEEVLQFLEFIYQPERQAALSNEIPYGPVHEEAFDYIDEDIKKTLVTYPENMEQMMQYDHQDWWGSVIDKYYERWEQWKLE